MVDRNYRYKLITKLGIFYLIYIILCHLIFVIIKLTNFKFIAEENFFNINLSIYLIDTNWLKKYRYYSVF